MSVTVRPARPADRPSIVALSQRLTEGMAAWRDPEMLRTAVRGWVDASTSTEFDGHALVAERDGTVVGFVSVSTTTHFSGEVDAYVGELVVDARFEGAGVGSALVAAAEEIAAESGCRCITLTTGAANVRAIGWYQHLGYHPEDVNLTKVLDP